jgi:uncharacterized protein (TIGR02145 family)
MKRPNASNRKTDVSVIRCIVCVFILGFLFSPSLSGQTVDFQGNPVSGVDPLQVKFIDQSTGAASTWAWSFPGGTPSSATGQGPHTVMYGTPGTYSVTLTVDFESVKGVSTTKENYITVTDREDASIGDCVWNDSNGNGVQDKGESGMSGVTVQLYGSDMTLLAEERTDAYGNYHFTALAQGSYFVRFIPPGGFVPTSVDRGSDDTVDSDADPETFFTAAIPLNESQADTKTDAGMIQSPETFVPDILEGFVRDTGMEPVNKVLVEMIDEADTTRRFSAFTDEQGHYFIQFNETGIATSHSLNPGGFSLMQNYPNPFNPSTVIEYELSKTATIRIEILDILGRKIRTLFNGYQPSGTGRMVWNGTDDLGRGVPAGVYICSLFTEGIRINRKMVMVDGGGSYSTKSGPQAVQNSLNKRMANRFRIRLTANDIEDYEQLISIKGGQTIIDITVIRIVSDIDNNRYRMVKIGNQWWIGSNLKVVHYRNGDAIPNVTDGTEWSHLETAAYCDYDNNPMIARTYGRLYNWFAVTDGRNIAPEGWHVATDEEWQILADYLGGNSVAGGKLREAGTTHWYSPNEGATNESGFSALPSGNRIHGPGGIGAHEEGAFGMLGYGTDFWTSTEYLGGLSFQRSLFYRNTEIERGRYSFTDGFSVRCVRDPLPPEEK